MSSVVVPGRRLAATVFGAIRCGVTSNGAVGRPQQQLLTTVAVRSKTHYRTGAIKPMPKVLPFGVVGLFASVLPGLFIGAAISKSVANFLEENELFVPSDDDDDED